MSGHASEKDIESIKQLDASLDPASSPTNELLTLGLLYLEPLHQEDQAIRVFEAILKREAQNVWATYWLAYSYLHYVLDNSALLKAKSLLESYVSSYPMSNGAIYELLANVLDDLDGSWRRGVHSERELPPPTSLQEKIDLLEESVRLEPEWVHNRMSLSWAYERAGRFEHAIRELEQAKRNIIYPDVTWDIIKSSFEEVVSGRTADTVERRIEERISHLKLLR
jgi:tetratricopeptide (TPR) repeat protein